MAEYRATAVPRPVKREMRPLEFPGCRPVRISRADLERSERRIEYWDAATETAMICDPVSVYHEHAGQRLRESLTLIAQVRGSPIATFGAADLLLRDADGAWRRILEADQTVYLHPRTTRPPGARIEVGTDTLPDVVLEVDNTTDVRRGKLSLYESWGFPEVWVEVPEQSSPSRPAGLHPGLTIYLLEQGSFRRTLQPRLSGLDGVRDPPSAERARAVGCHHGRVAQDRTNAGGGAGNRAGRRPAATHRAPGEPR